MFSCLSDNASYMPFSSTETSVIIDETSFIYSVAFNYLFLTDKDRKSESGPRKQVFESVVDGGGGVKLFIVSSCFDYDR